MIWVVERKNVVGEWEWFDCFRGRAAARDSIKGFPRRNWRVVKYVRAT